MSFNIRVTHELKQLRRDLGKVRRQVLPKAMASALNRTATQVQSASIKAISRETGLKQKDVRGEMRRSRAMPKRLAVTITARGRALNLIRFAARKVKKGVSAAPWRKRRVFKGAFIANQGRTVLKRVGEGRTPLRPVWGPGIAKSFADKPVRGAADKAFRERWPVNFKAALKFQLARLNGKITSK